MISHNMPVLEKLKDALLEHETLEEDAASKYMAKAVLPKEAALHK